MTDSSYYFRDTCRMCDSNKLLKAFSLSPTPPGNDLLTKNELGREEFKYPLEVYYCSSCSHLQLGHVVNPKILYQKNYTYVSATSPVFVDHLKNFATDMVKKFNLLPESLVMDIGSNDGTCLSFFKSQGLKVLGVDPAKDIAKKANEAGINTIGDFFSFDLAVKLKENFGPVKLITSHNACAHIDNLFDIVKGAEYLLADDGVFVIEVGYLVDVYENTWFDTIYHEHLDFHTLAPFKMLLQRVGMQLIGAERISPQGGSIRIFSQRKGGKHKIDHTIDKLIGYEKKLFLNKIETFYKFNKKIDAVKKDLKKILKNLKDQKKTIAGFGAPTKATTLMQHFDLDEKILDFIVDDNPLKQGLFTPISHIPIYSSDLLYELKPDYVLILAWNFANPIMNVHKKYANEIGKFIVPMPNPKIF